MQLSGNVGADQTPAVTAFSGSAGDLVGAFGDRVGDTPAAKLAASRIVGVGLVSDQHVRPLTRPSGAAFMDPDLVQQGHQLRIVAGLIWSQQHRQRPTAAVDRKVDLRGQAAPGAAQRFTMRRWYGDTAGRSPFLRAPAACWWARTTLESTLMIHSTG